MTSREVAALAGVSEASVFYHYKDRAGLLQAVFEQGCSRCRSWPRAACPGADLHDVLTLYGTTLEQFLDQALPVIAAAQSDAAAARRARAYMTEHDLGPHRGVRALGDYLAAEQAAGRVRAGVDPQAVAMMFVGACYTRASQRQMPRPRPICRRSRTSSRDEPRRLTPAPGGDRSGLSRRLTLEPSAPPKLVCPAPDSRAAGWRCACTASVMRRGRQLGDPGRARRRRRRHRRDARAKRRSEAALAGRRRVGVDDQHGDRAVVERVVADAAEQRGGRARRGRVSPSRAGRSRRT